MDPRDLELINELLESEADLKEVNHVLSYGVLTQYSFIQRIREQVGEFEKKTRIMTSTLDKVHSTPRSQSADVSHLRGNFLMCPVAPALLETIRPVLHNCHEIAATLAEMIPQDEVWKWRELWTAPLRAAVFSVVLAGFLTDGALTSLASVAEQLGRKSSFSWTFM